MATLEDIREELAVDTDQTHSIITLIERLADEVAQNIGDPAALQEIVDGMRANRQSLADAAQSVPEEGPTPPPEPVLTSPGEETTETTQPAEPADVEGAEG